MGMNNIENEMAVKYASIRVREDTRDRFEIYRSQLQGDHKNPNLTQDDGLLELLKCGEKARQEKRKQH